MKRIDLGLKIVALVVALITAVLGLVAILVPSIGLRLLGGGALLNAVGVVAFLLAGRAVWRRLRVGRIETKLPPPSERTPSRLAGEAWDTGLAERAAHVRDDLREVAIDVLEGTSKREAGDSVPSSTSERVESGDWTDNEDAAAFLAPSAGDADGLLPRLRERLRSTPTSVRRAEAVVSELGTVTGVTWPTEETREPLEAGDPVYQDLEPGEHVTRPTGRYIGAEAFPLTALGVGIFGRTPSLLLAAAAMVLLLGVVRSAPPPPRDLAVEHRLAATRARQGDTVKVTLAVTNESDRTIHDLRVVDRLPGGLSVERGRAALATALRPGATATTTYTVEAMFGRHEFGSVVTLLRDSAGVTETLLLASDTATLTCLPTLSESSTPPPPQTTPYSGQVETRSGGAGVEFFGMRRYRRGDALSRVDWKRLAKTGDLTTVEYREERAASVVVLIDARPEAYVAPTRSSSHAVARSVGGAATLVGGLLDDGDRVGIAALSPVNCWVPPGAGSKHRARLRTTFGSHPAFGPVPADASLDAVSTVARIRAQLSPGTSVVFFTPLIDDWPTSVMRRLRADGISVTVVSPDPTGGATLGTRVSRIQRAERLSELRSTHVSVIDWGRGDPLTLALRRHARR